MWKDTRLKVVEIQCSFQYYNAMLVQVLHFKVERLYNIICLVYIVQI